MDNSLVGLGSLAPVRTQRQLSRALEQIDAATALAIRQDAARLQRIAQTTQQGMMAVAHLASVEAALCQATPHAAGRIQAVAVAGAIQIVGVVHSAGGGV